MGGPAAVVRWECRHVWALLSRRGAMAGGGGRSTASESHGAGDDILHPAKFLLFGRLVRWLVARVGLDEYRTGRTGAKEARRAKNGQGSRGNLAARTRAHGELFAAARLARFEGGRAILLSMAGASSCGSLVGLGGASQQVRSRALRSTEFFRMV